MSFYTYRDVEIKLNNKKIIANSIELSQDLNIEHPIFQGEQVSERNVVNSPPVGNLRLSYFLTGLDPLKDYLYTNDSYLLAGDICGLKFNKGAISNYSINAEPHTPITVNVEIPFFDQLSGTFSPITPTGISERNILNFSDSSFTYNSSYSTNSLSNSIITNYTWNYKCDLLPLYLSAQIGLDNISSDRVSFNEKNISCQITCDTDPAPLSFNGEPFAISLKCQSPDNSSIYELYDCSGVLNSKQFSLDASSLSKTVLNISQSHPNSKPIIGAVSTFGYPNVVNYISVLSANNNPNGFLSSNENVNLIERVKIGDTYVPFTVTDGAITDTLKAYITKETINGYLTLETLKGTFQYPVPLTLDFPATTVSNISAIKGSAHTPITINGANFNRITDVLFNGTKAKFSLVQNTGATHQIVAFVPDNATVGKISVVSSLRNTSGQSALIFYPDVKVNGFSPTTGVWGSTITISGNNFSGVNGVFFNGVAAGSYNVISQNLLTATTPPFQWLPPGDYPKGKITVRTSNGLSGSSKDSYRPLFPITGLSVISGSADEDMLIGVLGGVVTYGKQEYGGCRVSFGNQDAIFYLRGNEYTFSGKIPPGFIGNEYISFYEPDGATKYPGFTGKFYGIGPAPKIAINNIAGKDVPEISPNNINLFESRDITIGGENMKDFFGLPNYFVVSGYGNEFKFSNLEVSRLNTKVIVKNVRVTGDKNIHTGYYDVYLKNYAGTGNLVKSGILVNNPARLIPNGSVTSSIQGYNGGPPESQIQLNNDIFDNSNSIPAYKNYFSFPSWDDSWHWKGPYSVAKVYDSGYCQNLTYFYEPNNNSLNAIKITSFTGIMTLGAGVSRKLGIGAISALSGYIEILTGNLSDNALGRYSSEPFRSSDSQYIAYTENFNFGDGNGAYFKSFSSPIKNFAGVRITHTDQITTHYSYIYVDDPYRQINFIYNPLNIVEIEMY